MLNDHTTLFRLGHIVSIGKELHKTLGAALAKFRETSRRLRQGKPIRPRLRLGKRRIATGTAGNLRIAELLSRGEPSMVARLGTTESNIVRYFVENGGKNRTHFPAEMKTAILELSGFFPPEDHLLTRFSQESLEHLAFADVMGVRVSPSEWGFWNLEKFLIETNCPRAELIGLEEVMPIGQANPWTKGLSGKKVLVIHPFAETIRRQYENRTTLFQDPDFLPEFDLQVMAATQSVGRNHKTLPFADWFEALDGMRKDLETRVFDVALIGAGAYGLFLAAECKKLGSIGIQVGGALQLMFGIKGQRWVDPTNVDSRAVSPLVNENWVSPDPQEIPLGAERVEGGCYW